MGFSVARFVLRRQTVSDLFRVQKHFLGAGILRVKLKHFQDSIQSVFVVGLFRNAELCYA